MKGQTNTRPLSAHARIQGLVHHWHNCSTGPHFAAFALFSCVHFTRPTLSTTWQHHYKYEACGLWSLENLNLHDEEWRELAKHPHTVCATALTASRATQEPCCHHLLHLVCVHMMMTSHLRRVKHFTFFVTMRVSPLLPVNPRHVFSTPSWRDCANVITVLLLLQLLYFYSALFRIFFFFLYIMVWTLPL